MKDHFRADSATFIAAGREDIDVRMCGSGRPFAVQLVNARQEGASKSNGPRLGKLEELVNRANPDIRINSLAHVDSAEVIRLNVGQEGEIFGRRIRGASVSCPQAPSIQGSE